MPLPPLDYSSFPHILDTVVEFSTLGPRLNLGKLNSRFRTMAHKLVQGATLLHDRLIATDGTVVYFHEDSLVTMSLLYSMAKSLKLCGPSYVLPDPTVPKATLEWLGMRPDSNNEYEGGRANASWPDHVNFHNLAVFVEMQLWEDDNGNTAPPLTIGVSPATRKVTICVNYEAAPSGFLHTPTLWLKNMATTYPPNWHPIMASRNIFQLNHFRQTTQTLDEVVLIVEGHTNHLYNPFELFLLLQPIFSSPVAFNRFILVCDGDAVAHLLDPSEPNYFTKYLGRTSNHVISMLDETRTIDNIVCTRDQYRSLVGDEAYARATQMHDI
ncbi:uncharacterized protein LOC62_07G009582 [Vanrija pseudolonga]|uniref:Uncharacterized protein n=1 Tax=Vanrija pseudolonga TaxID=143232 RepID=A0AAF0YM86_9TREE|nr:hypothetical protein LOC62_07G009582 [Vanrija pseudolonga]